MKNLILLPLILIMAVACNSKTNKSETVNSETTADTTVDNTTPSTPQDSIATQKPVVELFACPMHPEVTGKKDEKCPKCGMKLTEPVNIK